MKETFYYGFPSGSVDYKFYDLHYNKGKELYKNKQYEEAVFHLEGQCIIMNGLSLVWLIATIMDWV